jgi:hypothetical protein
MLGADELPRGRFEKMAAEKSNRPQGFGDAAKGEQ